MPKNSIIRWTKEDQKNLRKAVLDFNKRVRYLNKTRKNASYIPEEIDYAGTKDLIATRSELNRVLNSLGRFKGKEAFKKVTLPSGDSLTKWEKEEIDLQKRQAERRIKKRMSEIRRSRPEYFQKDLLRMGDEEYRRLESTLEAIQKFGEKRPKTAKKLSSKRRKELFNLAKARIENWGSEDFEMRSAIIYRENYYSMLEKMYSNFDNYDKLIEKLKSIDNPLLFYKTLSSIPEADKLKDITFMYETSEMQKVFNKLLNNLGIEIEEEDLEIESEEGE